MPNQLPKTDEPNKKRVFLILFQLCAVFFLILSFYLLNSYLKESSKIRSMDINVLGASVSKEDERLFWYDFLNEHPKYIPGWIRVAKIESELGNVSKTVEAYQKAVNINPNSSLISQFEDFLEKNN